MQCRKGNFHLFGVDVLIDKDLKPWFIEANTWADLLIFSETKRKTVPPMIKGKVYL